ncbi:hypothetical protein E4656_09665 [Natronospirillum operosum]|uniref:TVP38/TMEM64 family membrane protein n=1 Tax=Natronospirillum operosum TaxID=2759953 RepID=A0A4Z0WBL6_9GAMM|nr:hypothetical protein [Natronospirillum operosum]TGG93313.1 hypothetical protein E4656_09665 [Natronospirillum operosum]
MSSNVLYYGRIGLRVALILGLILVVVVGLVLLSGEGLISLWLDERQRWWVLLVTSLLYALLLAIPFVPGVELGWLIMGVFGQYGLVAAWFSTVCGLSLSYGVARRLRDHRWLERIHAARERLDQADPASLPPLRRLLRWGLCFYQNHPYVFLFVTLNLPGNWVIGGGGGIAALAGLARSTRYRLFLPTVAVATGLVPLLLWLGLMQT